MPSLEEKSNAITLKGDSLEFISDVWYKAIVHRKLNIVGYFKFQAVKITKNGEVLFVFLNENYNDVFLDIRDVVELFSEKPRFFLDKMDEK